MEKGFDRIYGAISRRLLRTVDGIIDQRICGQSLVKYVPSVYRDDANGVGMTGSQSTSYVILDRIFSHVSLTEEDSFLDVGCGKGRVLAFLLKEHAPCALYGVEINEISGSVAVEWTARYEQVSVKIGDAFEMDYNPYTVLFMNRPFLPKTFLEFSHGHLFCVQGLCLLTPTADAVVFIAGLIICYVVRIITSALFKSAKP